MSERNIYTPTTPEDVEKLTTGFKTAKTPNDVSKVIAEFMGVDQEALEYVTECERVSKIKEISDNEIVKHVNMCVRYFSDSHKDYDGDDFDKYFEDLEIFVDYFEEMKERRSS